MEVNSQSGIPSGVSSMIDLKANQPEESTSEAEAPKDPPSSWISTKWNVKGKSETMKLWIQGKLGDAGKLQGVQWGPPLSWKPANSPINFRYFTNPCSKDEKPLDATDGHSKEGMQEEAESGLQIVKSGASNPEPEVSNRAAQSRVEWICRKWDMKEGPEEFKYWLKEKWVDVVDKGLSNRAKLGLLLSEFSAEALHAIKSVLSEDLDSFDQRVHEELLLEWIKSSEILWDADPMAVVPVGTKVDKDEFKKVAPRCVLRMEEELQEENVDDMFEDVPLEDGAEPTSLIQQALKLGRRKDVIRIVEHGSPSPLHIVEEEGINCEEKSPSVHEFSVWWSKIKDVTRARTTV